jgi:metal-responsive CopG/Arc/MetJ family transcriptional regulator
MISRSKKRIQVSLSNLTMNELETFSNNNGIAKSLVIELALNDYFNRKDNHNNA